jgi:hypothetical protein
MRIPTAVASVASVVLAAVGVSACSPVIRPVLALTRQDGVLTALVYSCGSSSSVSVLNFPQPVAPASDAPLTVGTSTPSPTPTQPTYRVWSIASDDDFEGVREVALLAQPPEGWHARNQGAPVEAWEPLETYEVSARDSYDLRLSGREAGSVPTGDVLVANGYGDQAVMTRAAFEAQAEESC